MFRHIVAQSANETLAGRQYGYASLEIFQLPGEMEDCESQKSVHGRVSRSSQENRDSLSDERELELRALVHVVKVISLQRQRSAQIRKIRQVPEREAEIRKNNDHDKRQYHQNVSADNDRSSDLRSFDHHVPLLRRLRFHPVLHHHV